MTKKAVKRSLKRSKLLWVVAFIVFATLVLIAASLIPIEKMSYSAGCRSNDNRLSLILDGQQTVSQAREKIEKMNQEREEKRKRLSPLSDGCSPGLSYTVYVL